MSHDPHHPTHGPITRRERLACAAAFVLLLPLAGCRDSGTPEWNFDGTPQTVTRSAAAPATTSPPAAASPGEPLRFLSHNLQNWLAMQRTVDGIATADAPKPEPAKQALVAMIARHRPDILGVSEIGSPADLADLRDRLRLAGCDLPHLHHHQGADPVRALGLLSRHPLTPADRPADSRFRMLGREHAMLRGILDATSTLPCGRSFRFLGVHFKSKRETAEYDQEAFRNLEAHTLRSHLDTILETDPDARLVVFGDFNDTRRSRPLVTVSGLIGTPGRLVLVPARDSRGHTWTHHWRIHDLYSRFDYVFVSPALRRETNLQNARVLDDPEWSAASDHRPILVEFLHR